MLSERIGKHGAGVWLLNTGWTGGPYGVGLRFKLGYTRAMVTAILSGALAKEKLTPDPVFGLPVPHAVPGVPAEVLNPRNTWKDGADYDAQAKKLAKLFRENDAKFEMPEAVRAAGPRG
jgi:phosphoenolpyruvate carboxykinase (ATP)